MRVLYSFPLEFGRTGIGLTAVGQVESLRQLGISVTVVAGSMDRSYRARSGDLSTLSLLGIRVPVGAMGVDRACRFHDTLVARMLRQQPDRFDVVHCWPLGALRTLEACKAAGIAGVLERPNAHTGIAYRLVQAECARLGIQLPRGHSHRVNPRRLRREHLEYNAATVLACPSECVRESFIEKGFASEKLMRHQYGFDPTRVTSRSVRTSEGPLKAVFLGSGEPRKGLHFLLEAWRSSVASSAGELQVYGKLLPAYRQVLEARGLIGGTGVHFQGFTCSIAEALSRADVLILPSIEEGSAIVTYEARAAGCVLLVSDAAGAVCHHGHNALVHAAGDVATLRSHLDLVASQRHELERLRMNSLASLDELTWQHAGRLLMDVYTKAVNLARSSA